MQAPSYFVRTGADTFQPTHRTTGAWSETEQHFSPIGGLVVHAIEQHVGARGDGDELVLSSISFDILGVVALEQMQLQVRTIRPGRTIELVEATVVAGGRSVVIGRAWRLAPGDTASVAGGDADPLPPPASVARQDITGVWPGDYIRSLEVRAAGEPTPGRRSAWLRTDVDLVADEPCSDLARFIGLVDTANGIAVRESPRDWHYPNVDLGIHLHRHPRGEWVGLDTTVVFGPDGRGVTSTVLHDEHGPVGVAQQQLTVRRMPGG